MITTMYLTSVIIQININMRCIEISNVPLGTPAIVTININMRCIEIAVL